MSLLLGLAFRKPRRGRFGSVQDVAASMQQYAISATELPGVRQFRLRGRACAPESQRHPPAWTSRRL
jgi:hypothetical protein